MGWEGECVVGDWRLERLGVDCRSARGVGSSQGGQGVRGTAGGAELLGQDAADDHLPVTVLSSEMLRPTTGSRATTQTTVQVVMKSMLAMTT